MAEVPAEVQAELGVLGGVLLKLRHQREADEAAHRVRADGAAAAREAWKDAWNDPGQRELLEAAMDEQDRAVAAHRNAHRSGEVVLGTPYFGRIEVDWDDAPATEVLVGKVGVLEGGLRIIDWRAPLARLYYEYGESDAFEEDIAGRARSGEIALRRAVEIRDGVLSKLQTGDGAFVRRKDGTWGPPGDVRAEERDDHRLQDIVALITREQFAVIARPEAGVVLLRGRAGSGKTTVALHRVAYLHYRDPQRFRPDRTLVVMFNKALQTYISKVLPDLGLAGVPVETFHGWAGRILRRAGIELPFRAEAPAAVSRLARHPAMEAVIERALDRLGQNSASWLEERLSPEGRAAWDALGDPRATPDQGGRAPEARIGSRLRGLSRIAAFRRHARGPDAVLVGRLDARLRDHVRDLRGLFEDAEPALPPSVHGVIPAALAHHRAMAEAGALDWSDAALLLRIGQRKHQLDPGIPCPWSGFLAHVVIDEAQDLSTLEIAALIDAADEGRSVTIAGDPAQKILDEAQFAGFEALLERYTGRVQVRLDALSVGHRSTKPIMALALQVLGDASPPTGRDGDPVRFVDTFEQAVDTIRYLRARWPSALVAVLAKRKATADTWASKLKSAGIRDVRRAARDGFVFTPGVVVSNVHQVKGLEFDAVVLVDPHEFRDADRHLLHVAITRASERLVVVAPEGSGLLRPNR